jgi:predicted lipoprotein
VIRIINVQTEKRERERERERGKNRRWKEVHKEKLHNTHCSKDTVSVIRSRTIRWTGNVARMREKCKIVVIKCEGRGDTLTNVMIILKPNLKAIKCGDMV